LSLCLSMRFSLPMSWYLSLFVFEFFFVSVLVFVVVSLSVCLCLLCFSLFLCPSVFEFVFELVFVFVCLACPVDEFVSSTGGGWRRKETCVTSSYLSPGLDENEIRLQKRDH
jgi:hypothetical protein